MTDLCRAWRYFPDQVLILAHALIIFSGNWPFLFKLQNYVNLIIEDKVQWCKSLHVPSGLMSISETAHSSILKPSNPSDYKWNSGTWGLTSCIISIWKFCHWHSPNSVFRALFFPVVTYKMFLDFQPLFQGKK